MSIIKNNLSDNFTQVPNALITDKRLSSGAKIVAIYLYSKPSGWVVNNKDVMDNTNISKPHTMAKYWKELIDCGWVLRKEKRSEGKFNGGFDYELPHNAHNGQSHGVTEMPINGIAENRHLPKMGILNNTDFFINTDSNKHRGKNENHQQEPNPDLLTNTQQVRTIGEQKKPRFNPEEMDLPNFLPRTAWVDFCQHRKNIKKPLSELAAQKTIKTLESLSSEWPIEEVINASIVCGWAGVFALKDDSKKKKPRRLSV